MKTLGTIVAIFVVVVAACAVNNPTYSYRYRLTVAIEVDGAVHQGSSVIQVIWRGQPNIGDLSPFMPSIRGEAALVDLGPRGVVVATLTAPSFNRRGIIVWPEGVSALWLAQWAFGLKGGNEQLPLLRTMSGRRELTANNMPQLIWFPNPADPKSARRVRAGELEQDLGPTARLAAARVEITADPIVITINKKFPWVATFDRPGTEIKIGYGFSLVKVTFVGDEP
jgi:hypothetical protein